MLLSIHCNESLDKIPNPRAILHRSGRDLVQSKHSSILPYPNASLAAPQASNGVFAAANLRVTLHCQKYSEVVPFAIGAPL